MGVLGFFTGVLGGAWAFFHSTIADIETLIEEEKLLKIMDLDSLRKANLTPRERDAVLNHANKAALLAQTYPRLPQGVDIIIKQHHGVSNGVGFPEALTAGISPMAIFFVVVEDFMNIHNFFWEIPGFEYTFANGGMISMD